MHDTSLRLLQVSASQALAFLGGSAAWAPRQCGLQAVTSLRLSVDELPGSGQQLSENLRDMTCLAELRLNHGLACGSIASIAQVLLSSPCLTSLHLESVRLGQTDATALVAALRARTTLRAFTLADNSLGALAASTLAAVCESCAALTQLQVTSNGLGLGSSARWAPALQSLAALQVLRLSSNGLGVADAAALSTSLPRLLALTELCVARNNFGDAGVRLLVHAICGLTVLRLFDVGGNGAEGSARRVADVTVAASCTALRIEGLGCDLVCALCSTAVSCTHLSIVILQF